LAGPKHKHLLTAQAVQQVLWFETESGLSGFGIGCGCRRRCGFRWFAIMAEKCQTACETLLTALAAGFVHAALDTRHGLTHFAHSCEW